MPKSSSHPSDHELRSFAAGGLDELAWSEVEKHLTECEDCARRIANLSVNDDTFLESLKHAEELPGCPSNRHAGINSKQSLRNPAEETQSYKPGAESLLPSGTSLGRYTI